MKTNEARGIPCPTSAGNTQWVINFLFYTGPQLPLMTDTDCDVICKYVSKQIHKYESIINEGYIYTHTQTHQ